MEKSVINKIIKEEIDNNIVNEYYYKIIDQIRQYSKKLNDDQVFELHEKLKKFFNRTI